MESATNSNSSRLDAYKREFDLHKERLIQAQANVDREQKYCTHLQGLIDLETQGSQTTSGEDVPKLVRRSITAVARQSDFADIPVADAAFRILRTVPKLHADELTKRIFVADTPERFARAKNQLVSEMVRKEKQGTLIRTGPNEFALPLSNEIAPPSVNGTGGAEKPDAS